MRERKYGLSFRLDDEFLENYVDTPPSWGFGVLSETTMLRTYSRSKDARMNSSWPYDVNNLKDFVPGGKERWWEICERVICGQFSIQKEYILSMRMTWDEEKAQRSAQEAYDRLFNLKWSPAGRGLWAMGTYIVNYLKDSSPLYNCFFISTKDIDKDFVEPFVFLMDASMMGGGVGFDTLGAGKATIVAPKGSIPYKVPDTREGWVKSMELVLKAFQGGPMPKFDYSLIRAKGEPIITFGGVAPGPEPLMLLHERMVELLVGEIGNEVTSRLIVDLMNMIGVAVASGNVRRSAEIALGEYNDNEFWHLKDYSDPQNEYRSGWGYMSNNTLIVREGQKVDYDDIARRIANEGEPGLMFIDNARNYGRMNNGPNYADLDIEGSNPCGEIGLANGEACNLVEQFLNRAESKRDFHRTLKFGYLYAKTVTLMPTRWPKTNQQQLRNRRIGSSITGTAQFVDTHDYAELQEWLDEGYRTVRMWDEIYSKWFCVRDSIKVTTSKPSGTVSLLAGATPGVHWPTATRYLRRITLDAQSPLIAPLKDAGYTIEDKLGEEGRSVLAVIPVHVQGVRAEANVSIHEKIALVRLVQEWWADNMVSNTQVFDPETEVTDLANALKLNAGRLKSVSALPRYNQVYEQMPEEEVGKAKFDRHAKVVGLVDYTDIYDGKVLMDDAIRSMGCDTDACEIESPTTVEVGA